jgi:hypothetical protein
MPDDAIAIAQAATAKADIAIEKFNATAAQIFSIQRETDQRFKDFGVQQDLRYQNLGGKIEQMDKTMMSLDTKVDLLLAQANVASGKAERDRLLFGGVPNVFWGAFLDLLKFAILGVAVALGISRILPH